MVKRNQDDPDLIIKLIAARLSGRDAQLVLEEFGKSTGADDQSMQPPPPPSGQSDLPTGNDGAVEELPAFIGASEADVYPASGADAPFPALDRSALDDASDAAWRSAPALPGGAPSPTTTTPISTPESLAAILATACGELNREMVAAQMSELERGRHPQGLDLGPLGPEPQEPPPSPQEAAPGPSSALELLEATIVCERCGHAGLRLDIPRPPYRYVCAACLEAQFSPMSSLLRKARTRWSSQLLLRAGVTGEVLLYSLADLRLLWESASSGESNAAASEFLSQLIASGNRRPLSQLASDWAGRLDVLEAQHPNFSQVIREVIRPILAIRAAGGRARPVPMLLLGEPGVGKTHFARALAAFLTVPSITVDMASAQSGATLAGSSSFWSNSAPGELSRLLAFGSGGRPAHADPVVFVDEVDKVGQDLTYDPLGALYQLLEVESARQFTDLALPGLRLDASHVRWILAANSLEGIPQPILSRVRVMEIRAPSGQHQQALLRRVFAQMVRDTGIGSFSEELPTQVVQRCGDWGLREFKNVVNAAIGFALSAGRSAVTAQDFDMSAPGRPGGAPRQGMGFVSAGGRIE